MFSKQLPKSFGSPQQATQVEGGSLLQGWPYVVEPGKVSVQGYHGTSGSGSTVLLKAMCFAEYFCLKELIFSDGDKFHWKTPTLLLLRILMTRVLITMLNFKPADCCILQLHTNLCEFFNKAMQILSVYKHSQVQCSYLISELLPRSWIKILTKK